MSNILRLNLKAVELILNNKIYTNGSKSYWEEERQRLLKELLKYQLENFC